MFRTGYAIWQSVNSNSNLILIRFFCFFLPPPPPPPPSPSCCCPARNCSLEEQQQQDGEKPTTPEILAQMAAAAAAAGSGSDEKNKSGISNFFTKFFKCGAFPSILPSCVCSFGAAEQGVPKGCQSRGKMATADTSNLVPSSAWRLLNW